MEELDLKMVDVENQELSQYLRKIIKLFHSQQSNFAELCYLVYKIDCWFEDNPDVACKSKWDATYYNEKSLFKSLGFSNKQVCRYCNCYQKFMTLDDVGSKIKEPFVSFAPSKLFEMLPVSTDKLIEFINNGQLSAEMTVKQIREFFKTVEEKEDVPDEEISSENVEEDYFLVLKNDTARKDFLSNYKTWGLWFEEPRLKLKYFRCKIGDKVLVAISGKTETVYYYDQTTTVVDTHKFYWMSQDGEMFLDPTCETAILKFMSAVEDKKVYLFER